MLQTRRLLNFFACGVFALLYVTSTCAQQPGQGSQQGKQLDVPTIESFPPPAKGVPQQEFVSLPFFASHLAEILDSVRCREKKDCRILVADFVSPEGYVSAYGVRLADELSGELARQKNWIAVANRAQLGKHLSVLREERVPANVQRSPSVIRWLGGQANASVVLVGEIEGHTSSTVRLSAYFLSVEDRKLVSPTIGVALPLPPSLEELSTSDPLAPPPLFPETINGERIYRAGQQGVGMPKCHYMPNPPYTDEARRFNLSGSLVIEGVVDTHGAVRNPRIVRGLPFGLNEITARTLSTWKCDPALMSGQPVSTFVPFEVTFHLY